MSSRLYGRRARIYIATDAGAALDISELRITFEVKKAMAYAPNQAKATIYNLAPETQNTIISTNNQLIIEAGYEGDQYGVIFQGNILRTWSQRSDGTDYTLGLLGLDGANFLGYGIVSGSYAAGATPRQIIQDSATKVSVPTQLGQLPAQMSDTKLPRGKVMFGRASDYYRQIAKGEGAMMYIEDGVVNLIKAEDVPPGEVIELSPASGLIGTPTQTQTGISGKCLLNPRLKLGGLVKISSQYINQAEGSLGSYQVPLASNGQYRIIKLTHSGDTRGNTWYSEFEAISQAGYLPGMIGTSAAQPWY